MTPPAREHHTQLSSPARRRLFHTHLLLRVLLTVRSLCAARTPWQQVSDKASLNFMNPFYHRLLRGSTVEDAFNAAVANISLDRDIRQEARKFKLLPAGADHKGSREPRIHVFHTAFSQPVPPTRRVGPAYSTSHHALLPLRVDALAPHLQSVSSPKKKSTQSTTGPCVPNWTQLPLAR